MIVVGPFSELEFVALLAFCQLRTLLNFEQTSRSVRNWMRASTLLWRALCANLHVPIPATLNSRSASNLAMRLRDLYLDHARFAFVDEAAFASQSLHRGALVRAECVQIHGSRIHFLVDRHHQAFRFARSVLSINLQRSAGPFRLRIAVELLPNDACFDKTDLLMIGLQQENARANCSTQMVRFETIRHSKPKDNQFEYLYTVSPNPASQSLVRIDAPGPSSAGRLPPSLTRVDVVVVFYCSSPARIDRI